MEDKKFRKNIIEYNIISNLISCVIIIAVITLLLIIFKKPINKYISIIKIVYLIVIAYSLVSSFVYPFIEIKIWHYSLTESKLEYKYGIYVRKRTVIPISKIQHITVKQNPISNYFKIAELEVVTINGDHTIRNISIEEGNILVERISDIIFVKEKNKENSTKEDYYEEI